MDVPLENYSTNFLKKNNMALIELFKQKFEKMVDNIPASIDSGASYVIDEVYKILDSLNSTKLPEGLEEVAEKYRRESCNATLKPNVDGPMPEYGGSIKAAFIAGAEWGIRKEKERQKKMVENYIEGRES